MDSYICMVESLDCSPGTLTTSLVGYTPIQNKKFKRRRKQWRMPCESGLPAHANYLCPLVLFRLDPRLPFPLYDGFFLGNFMICYIWQMSSWWAALVTWPSDAPWSDASSLPGPRAQSRVAFHVVCNSPGQLAWLRPRTLGGTCDSCTGAFHKLPMACFLSTVIYL